MLTVTNNVLFPFIVSLRIEKENATLEEVKEALVLSAITFKCIVEVPFNGETLRLSYDPLLDCVFTKPKV